MKPVASIQSRPGQCRVSSQRVQNINIHWLNSIYQLMIYLPKCWNENLEQINPNQIKSLPLLNCPDMESPWLNGTWECNKVPPTPQVMSTDIYSQLIVLAFSFSISLGFDSFTKLQKFSNIFQCSSPIFALALFEIQVFKVQVSTRSDLKLQTLPRVIVSQDV